MQTCRRFKIQEILRGIVLGCILGVPAGLGFYLYLDFYGVSEANAYIETGNTEYPRTELTSDPTNGRIAQLATPDGTGFDSLCSAALVGPDLVLTAAHCLNSSSNQKSVAHLGMHSGAQGYTYADGCRVSVLHTSNQEGWRPADYALLQVNDCMFGDNFPGNRFGWYNLQADFPKEAALTALGYPGSENYGTLWESPGVRSGSCWSAARCNETTFQGEMRISGGNSGGPVLLGDTTSDTLVGVVSAVTSKGSSLIQGIDPNLTSIVQAHNARVVP